MRTLTGILICLFMAGCNQSPLPEVEQSQEGTPDSGLVILNQEQIEIGKITLGTLTREVLSKDIKAKGKLILRWQKNAFVGTMIGGTVESIFVNVGDRVSKGKLLATITSPEIIEVQQKYISTRSLWEFQKNEFERQELLNKEKINADKRLQEARKDLTDLEAKHQSLRMQMEMFNIPLEALNEGQIQPVAGIVTPISGTVEEMEITIGEYVEPNKTMFQIIDKDNLLLEIRVFEKDFPYISIGQRVTFTLANLGPGVYEATVISIGKTVEQDARTVKVIASFNNTSQHILPGMFASAEIHTDEQEVDALPEEAVTGVGTSDAFIYFTISPDSDSLIAFRRMGVTTGFAEDGYIQIFLPEPMPPDARVVVSGSYFVKSEALKQGE
ncbi:MAG: efflux RND transporter periplasmic adaptor subunit [Bacteroidia bacterium]|nr:efflux RND transporter periplasmic adaptor subunit [Bacteroidia bacterium]